MARMAIEEVELRKSPFAPKLRLRIKTCCSAHGFGLTHRPETHRIGTPFARGVVVINIVVLLERAKQVEFKGHTRVARRHHLMSDELAGLL